MAKKKWSNSLDKELTKAVHAFNEKIRYHENKGKDILPEREYARDLKKKLKNEQEIQREINRLRRFGTADVTATVKIGYQDSLEVTQYEVQELKRQLANINAKRARKLAKIQEQEVSVSGKPTGYKRGQMPSFREADLKPKKLNLGAFRSKDEFIKYKGAIEQQRMQNYFDKRAEQFKLNYIESLKTRYGANNVKKLTDKLESMSAKDIEDKYYTEQDASIRYVYTETTEEWDKIENIFNIWGVQVADTPQTPVIEI